MATILLSAAGAAVGSAVGGGALGLTSTVIGRAVGATLGRVIDARLLGAGADPVETPRVARFRVSGAGEGEAVARLWGGMRLGGQVIWASRFLERATTTGGGGGKGGPPSQPSVTRYSYSVSLALALCEGEIARVGRVWADGAEVPRDDLNLRVYTGRDDQLPDPKIEAVEGAGVVPAYRGLAYVVIEDLDLGRFGNRVPQFSFEVIRPVAAEGHVPLSAQVRGVALIPGTGEYGLATTPVHVARGPGVNASVNVNTPAGKTDFAVSLDQLAEGLPQCRSALMVVSWFGDDLRAGQCKVQPKVEDASTEGQGMAWSVAGRLRAGCPEIAKVDGRSVYGGTPADAAVLEGIAAMKAAGQDVVFYPFILMEQLAGNGLPDPWSDAPDQPALPWRGRITLSQAPGRPGSPDGTAGAEAEVAAFFGSVRAADFTISGGAVSYHGPQEWTLSRFILHYAALCKAAGGVTAFCIGSELRSLTQIRGPGHSFPAVAALRALAGEVRALLGPEVKIGYAADWSEYFGYHPQDGSGDVFFHLDPLWADEAIDFIGIDNYMPLSDWRDGIGHLDAQDGAVTLHDLAYLRGNIEGGEGYDWYYASAPEREAQRRTPIVDAAHGEDWVFRYKDLRGWWENPHHDRIGGVRQVAATAWVPRSKPFWFTELGCAAIDKGTNEPNKFLDALSSESALPRYSNGRRDDLIQARYLQAMLGYWSEPAHNPVSPLYGGPMVDMARAHVWAWDARPWPAFPNATEVWSDGPNHARGHWLSGRIEAQDLGAVIAELCQRSGLGDVDVSDVHGLVRGFVVDQVGSARAALQQLMLVHGLDAVETGGRLVFRSRRDRAAHRLDPLHLAVTGKDVAGIERSRAASAELAGRVRLTHVDAQAEYQMRTAEAAFPDEVSRAASDSEMPMALLPSEGRGVAERWLAEQRIARDRAVFRVPPSQARVGVGDLVRFADDPALWRVDRALTEGARRIEAVRAEPHVFVPSDAVDATVSPRDFVPPVPVFPLFLDLPLMTGEEVEHAPHLAVAAQPWPGSVAVYGAVEDAGYALDRLVEAGATLGVTETPLARAVPGRFDRGAPLRVRLTSGALTSISPAQLWRGGNLAAIGDGDPANWEVFQFARADVVEPMVYALSERLRGQLGSEPEMRDSWPVGSYVVLLNGAVGQIGAPAAARGLIRHFRIGPAARGYDDPSYVHQVHAFAGRGLRPYAPAQLRARWQGGDLSLAWVRRTRVDGDRWEAGDVPLGEAQEAYVLRIEAGEDVLREVHLTTPSYLYPAALRAADGVPPGFQVAVAQLSDRYGPGPFRRMDVHE